VSFKKLVFIITMMAVMAMAARFSIDADTWWHLRAGRWIWENKEVPQVDPFSYTRRGEPWRYPGWMMQIILYGIYAVFSAGGLNIITALFVTATFFLLWKTISGNYFLKAFVVILAAATSGVYWAARPYLITFLFSSLYLFILEKRRTFWGTALDGNKRKYDLWILGGVMVLWANSHGGFAVGFILVGIYGVGMTFQVGIDNLYSHYRHQFFKWSNYVSGQAGEKPNQLNPKRSEYMQGDIKRWKWFWKLGLILIFAVCLNPYGPEMLMYPFKTVGIDTLVQYIEEWQSPNFHQARVQPFLLLLFLTFGAVGSSKKRLTLTDFLLVSVFGVLSLMAARNIALFSLPASLVLTRYGVTLADVFSSEAAWLNTDKRNRNQRALKNLLNWAILLLIAGVVIYKISLIVPADKNMQYVSKTFPDSAVNIIKENEYEGRLFNTYNWGGYLIWSLPEYPVFVDGRTDLYGDEVVTQWVTVVRGDENWQDILDQWEVNVALIEPHRPLVDKLKNAGWSLEYEDQKAVVLIR